MATGRPSPVTVDAVDARSRAGLASSLYEELHRLAAIKMRFERGNHTLQSTAQATKRTYASETAQVLFEEIALQLDVSTRTIKRDWTMARAWLRHELSPTRDDS